MAVHLAPIEGAASGLVLRSPPAEAVAPNDITGEKWAMQQIRAETTVPFCLC